MIIEKLDEINGKVDGLGHRMDGLDHRMDVLDRRVSNLETGQDELKVKVANLESNQDRLIDRMIDMDSRMDSFATKDELRSTEDRIVKILDRQSAILERLDQERLVTNDRINRHDEEIRTLMFRVSQPQ